MATIGTYRPISYPPCGQKIFVAMPITRRILGTIEASKDLVLSLVLWLANFGSLR